jgi:1-acyl-sn-glycerol-3-phosphate acyltransferase
MKSAWAAVRSVLLWAVSGIHFFIVAPLLVALSFVLDHRKHDYLQRSFCRRIVFLAGAKVQVHRAPGFDPTRTSFFISNHVNLFDPFVLYCAIPQFARGWELESHFKIPAYGWLMKHFGNVPVPDIRRPSDLKRMWRLTREAVDGGTSLIVFPEGGRTRDGRVGAFQDGAFRLALHLGVPIVPVSIVGSFEHHSTSNWTLRAATIAVHLHDTIDPANLSKHDATSLRERVQSIVSAPVDERITAVGQHKAQQ